VSTKHSAAGERGVGAVIVGLFVQHTGPASSFFYGSCIDTIYLVTFNKIILIVTIIFTNNSPHNFWCADWIRDGEIEGTWFTSR
jgi:hypothetical protein